MFKSEKQKRTAIIVGIAFVVIYAILYLLIQAGYSADNFGSFGKTILSVFAPVLIGGIIAYLLNPFLRLFERTLLKKISRPKLRRALGVLLTYLLVLLLIVGLFAAILPQIVASIQEFGSNINNYAIALQTAVNNLFDDLNLYIDEHPSLGTFLENMGIYDWMGRIIEEDLEKQETAELPDTTVEEPEITDPIDTDAGVVDPETTEPETTEPETTEPETTEPETTEPETTEPEMTEPETTEPETTEPETTEPETTEPETTEPETTTGLTTAETDSAESSDLQDLAFFSSDSSAEIDSSMIEASTDTAEEPPTSEEVHAEATTEITPSDAESSPKHELSFEAFSDFLMDKLSSISAVFTEQIDDLANYLVGFGLSFVSFLKNILLGLFISIYLLLSKERVGAQCKRMLHALFPQKTADEVLRITKYSDKTVGRFFVGTIVDAVIVSLVTLILLSFFKIKYALLIAIIIGVTNMIPFFGPFIGSIPSAILLLIDDITIMVNNPDAPVRFQCVTFIILILVIQQIDGNIINPRVIGNSTGLSSLGVILSVTIMSGLFGFFGMLLGVPVAAIIIGLCSDFSKKRLAKKNLPTTLAYYYSENSAIPPESDEEDLEYHEHTAFYRWMVATRKKLRQLFRKRLYKNSDSKSLRLFVGMKLGLRNVRHKVNHTIHPKQQKNDTDTTASNTQQAEDAGDETNLKDLPSDDTENR